MLMACPDRRTLISGAMERLNYPFRQVNVRLQLSDVP